MSAHRMFELYPAEARDCERGDVQDFSLRFAPDRERLDHQPDLVISQDETVVWARWDENNRRLRRTKTRHDGEFCFYVLRYQFSSRLALISRRRPVLVNGLPALSLAVVATRDSLTLGPETFYVTERIRPHVGRPTEEMIGLKCPMCRVAVDAESVVVTCICGAVYHHETEQSHPDLPADERLNCLDQIRVCLVCNRPVTPHEHLVWDPQSV